MTLTLTLQAARNGIVLGVRAKPRAARDAIVGVRDGDLLIHVTQAPEAGAANDAIVRLLSHALGVARDAVTLSVGGATRRKRFKVAGISEASARARLATLLTAEPGG